MTDQTPTVPMEKIVSLAQRRGFIFPSSDIYGGLSGCWDYGPLGIEMKRNIKQAWWQAMVQNRDDMVGIETSILMARQVWEASGHTERMIDPLVECKRCHSRFREDDIEGTTTRLQVGLDNLLYELSSDGTMLFVRDLIIDAPNSSITLKWAELTSGGRRNEPLSKGTLLANTELSKNQYPLAVGEKLYPGERRYVIGFGVVGGVASARIRLVLNDSKDIFVPIDIYIRFSDMGVSGNLATHYCPSCGGELTEARMFNVMFKTFVGPVEDSANIVYLRPETAQGMFVNFDNVLQSTRKKLPFGIAQQGKSFRNEITTGNFIFRSREFEQMEMEYFVRPDKDEESFNYWVQERFNWFIKYGLKREHLSLSEHPKEKLAHYAKRCIDITYLFPHGWAELEGIANRTDYDLKQHSQISGKTLDYYDDDTKEHYTPYVIEPAVGVDRSLLAFLCDAYAEEPDKDETRVVMHFHPALAPIKTAILPLSKKENLSAFAKDVYKDLRAHLMVQYDDTQSIGRRYRRQDEVGTPYCVTVDFQSLEDKRVTIRERDSMNQIRIPVGELLKTLTAKLEGEDLFVLPPGGEIWKKAGE